MSFPRRALGLCLVAAAALLLLAPAANAEVFTVNTTENPIRGPFCEPTICTLRGAVASSNASTAVDDLIVVPGSVVSYPVNLEALELTDQVEIRGAGAGRTVLHGDGASPIFEIKSPGVLIDGLTITGGAGGIQNDGELTLRGVSVDHNAREGAGGAIQSNGALTIDSSFIGFNQAAGISEGGIQANAPVTLLNSTLAENTSTNGSAAIQVNAPLSITSSAVVGNTSGSAVAPALRGAPLTLRDSIVAANSNTAGILNCGAPATSLGGNVEDTASCVVGAKDRPNGNPGLGPLALNGGTTLVHSLLPGSAAIDFAGACPALDQRGAPRPRLAACDSGPFEVQPQPPVVDRRLGLGVAGGKLKLSRRGIARLKLSCPINEATPPCSGRVVLSTRGKVRKGAKRLKLRLASGRFSIGAGKSVNVTLKLSAANAALVRGSKAARKVVAEVRATDGAGNAQLIKKKLALVPR